MEEDNIRYLSVPVGYRMWTEVTQLSEEFENLDIICNVRSHTALYELPTERTGKIVS